MELQGTYTDGEGTRAWKEFHAMIARVWRGIAAPETASNYLEHLQHTIFPELSEITGYQGASVLRRDSDAGVEFTVQTLWDSMDAIGQFAGEQVETAVVAPAAQPLFRSYDRTVTHYEVVLAAQKQLQLPDGNSERHTNE
jgi:heme-degrading monooxygenase HmoA